MEREIYLRRRELLMAAPPLLLTSHTIMHLPSAQAAAPPMARRPIFKSLKFPMVQEPGSVRERFQLLVDLGYDGVEIEAPGGPAVEEYLQASRDTGLPIHGVVDSTHWKKRASDPDPDVRKQCLADLISAIQTCHAVGGSAVLFVPGHAKDGNWSTIEPRIHEVVHAALPTSAKLGIRILFENVWNDLFYDAAAPPEQSAQPYADFIDSFQSPWVGAYFDIGNHHKYGQPQEWIRLLGHRIVKLDVKDFDRSTGKFCPLKAGTIDWPAVRSALDEIGYTGWCTAELGGGKRDYLSSLLADMQQILPN